MGSCDGEEEGESSEGAAGDTCKGAGAGSCEGEEEGRISEGVGMGSEGVWSVVGAGADGEDGLEPDSEGGPAEGSPTECESIDGAWVGVARFGVGMGAAVIGIGSAVAGGVVVGGAGVNGDVVGVCEAVVGIGGDMVGTDVGVFGVGGAVAGADAVVMDGLAVGVKGDGAEDELSDCDGSVVGGIVSNVVVVGMGVNGGVEGEVGKGASAMGLYGRI